jgi:hypothetical protein
MNRNDLRAALEKERINPRWYSIGGITEPPIEEQCVLEEDKGKWLVYYLERGHKTSLRVFESEDEACRYFLDWILDTDDPHLRLK